MDKFLAGLAVGVLFERFHLIELNPTFHGLLHTDYIKTEVLVHDIFFLTLAIGGFAFFAWAIRALNH